MKLLIPLLMVSALAIQIISLRVANQKEWKLVAILLYVETAILWVALVATSTTE